MMHWRARMLLASLPDGTLPGRTETALLEHVDRCERCRRDLGELQQVEELLRCVPASLLPLEASLHAQARLWSLGRWTEGFETPSADRWRATVLGLAGAFAIAAVTLSLGVWSPIFHQRGAVTTLASVAPESSYLPPRTTMH